MRPRLRVGGVCVVPLDDPLPPADRREAADALSRHAAPERNACPTGQPPPRTERPRLPRALQFARDPRREARPRRDSLRPVEPSPRGRLRKARRLALELEPLGQDAVKPNTC